MIDISFTSKAQGHYKNHQSKAKTLYLSLWLMRIFLGVNLGLGSNNFSLGDHIPNCKGILGGVGISFILPLLLLLCFLFCLRCHHCPILLFFSLCWYFSMLSCFLWGPLGSTLGPPSSDRSPQGFLPDQGLNCTFQHSTPYRPRSL